MDTLLSRVITIRVRTSPACAAPGVPRRMNQTVPCFNRIAMQQAPSRPGAFFEYSTKAMQYNVNPPSTERARERMERNVTNLTLGLQMIRSQVQHWSASAPCPSTASCKSCAKWSITANATDWILGRRWVMGRQVARSPFQGRMQCFSLPQLTNCTAVCSQPHSMPLSVPPKVLAMSQHENVTQESRDWTMLGRKDKKSTAQNYRSQHVTMTAAPGPAKGMRLLHLGERRWDMSGYARLEVRCKLNPNNLLYIHLTRGLEKLDFSKS